MRTLFIGWPAILLNRFFFPRQTAKPYITYGTRVVDLDGQRILVNMPDADLDREDVPAAILEFFGVEFSDSKRFLKSAMNSKSNEFAPWKTSKLPMQNYLAQRAKPFFAILVNLLGYFRQCTSPSGQVDFRQMVACQACPPLEPFLVQLYESQMIHCFLYDRLSTHTADDFEIQAHLLADKCRERLQHNPSNKPNFGDLRWISCKRSMTTNSRFRRKLGQQWSKLTSKAALKANQLKLDKSTAKLWEKVSTDGIPGPPAITYSRSMGPTENPGSGRPAASNE
uniref:Uncharacterized protein n=1 Tax=Mesocestoides corti TaxID=53468 RepID=A0A5K3FN43_MESCO